ncbi:cell wall hydrolase [Feifania hominis]|uniref:Cell wall hydrolase n=1 Tax=Feifania hominis TaxID=2763660 RepID=A0A926DEP6_9FIRM|nr:cell wall hydrolase [Feifania hominis]MBC8537248.1 cell wall hydrolase [Feifania hominis]
MANNEFYDKIVKNGRNTNQKNPVGRGVWRDALLSTQKEPAGFDDSTNTGWVDRGGMSTDWSEQYRPGGMSTDGSEQYNMNERRKNEQLVTKEQYSKNILGEPGSGKFESMEPSERREYLMNNVFDIRELIARTIYGEQTHADQQLPVAFTIYNRKNYHNPAEKNYTKKNYWDIVSEPGQFTALSGEGGNVQSFYIDYDSEGWKNALELADDILDGVLAEQYKSPISTYTQYRTKNQFYNHYDPDRRTYADKPIEEPITIGNHVFFKYIG